MPAHGDWSAEERSSCWLSSTSSKLRRRTGASPESCACHRRAWLPHAVEGVFSRALLSYLIQGNVATYCAAMQPLRGTCPQPWGSAATPLLPAVPPQTGPRQREAS